MRKLSGTLGLALASLLVSLVLAEVGFRVAADGAFPHLNVYEADAALGTRLRPGAAQKVSFHGNPVTDVRINGAGFRGAEWPAPAEGEIVVVGDSQAFGLGVEEDESIPARLAVASGRPTLNAGVPTYGPDEYLAVIERLLRERKPRTVVLLVNVSNDFFELSRPNVERHRVWDGWAVRAETMPDEVMAFPGRQWLFRDSHLVFALRRALYQPPDGAGRGLPSEGTPVDVVFPSTGPAAAEVVELQSLAASAEPEAEPATVVAATARTAASNRSQAWHRLFRERQSFLKDWSEDDELAVQAVEQHNRPGDIVYEPDAESGRHVPVTAELLRKAASLRGELVEAARAWVERNPEAEGATEIRKQLVILEKADAERAALATVLPGGVEPSPLIELVLAAREACAGAGAELVVAVLPLDVQVSPEEWAKYGAPAQDMTSTRALNTDLVAGARHAGVRAVDLIGPLAAAQPGAFLDGDLHLSPRGTDAVAAAIAAVLREPAPVARPAGGLPEGRSRLPDREEFRFAPEIRVTGSTRNRCSTRQLREWLFVECVGLPQGYGGWVDGSAPQLEVVAGPLERAVGRDETSARLLVPLLPGREVRAAFVWPKREMLQVAAGDAPPWVAGRRETLVVRWEGSEAVIAFEPSAAGAAASSGAPVSPCVAELWQAPPWANLDLGCARSFPDSCEATLQCGLGYGTTPPSCTEAESPAGTSGWCYALCSPEQPCAEGVCTPWQGGSLCM